MSKNKLIKILIIDDEYFMSIGLKNSIEIRIKNVLVDIATGPIKGLEYIQSNDYDVVLLDWLMPIPNGIENKFGYYGGKWFLAHLKGIYHNKIVIYTAKENIGEEYEQYQIIRKPMRPCKIIDVLMKIIDDSAASTLQ